MHFQVFQIVRRLFFEAELTSQPGRRVRAMLPAQIPGRGHRLAPVGVVSLPRTDERFVRPIAFNAVIFHEWLPARLGGAVGFRAERFLELAKFGSGERIFEFRRGSVGLGVLRVFWRRERVAGFVDILLEKYVTNI